jgi:hypothetical protein
VFVRRWSYDRIIAELVLILFLAIVNTLQIIIIIIATIIIIIIIIIIIVIMTTFPLRKSLNTDFVYVKSVGSNIEISLSGRVCNC